jgi:uncharacterized protein YqfB (UPF0267 family)
MRQMITIFILSLVLLAILYTVEEKRKSEKINITELQQIHKSIYPNFLSFKAYSQHCFRNNRPQIV